MSERDDNVPPFLKKDSRRKKARSGMGASLGAEAAKLYLRNIFLETELNDQERLARENEQKAERLEKVTTDLQDTLSEAGDYTKYLLRANRGYQVELNDAYGQLGRVPKQLDQAWKMGYLERVKEVALMRIEARRRERENRIGVRAVNFIRDRVTFLGNRIRNIF